MAQDQAEMRNLPFDVWLGITLAIAIFSITAYVIWEEHTHPERYVEDTSPATTSECQEIWEDYKRVKSKRDMMRAEARGCQMVAGD